MLRFQKVNKEVSSILKSKVQGAIQKLKIRSSPGEDIVTNAALKLGGDTIVETLTELYNKCLEEEKVVISWMKAIVVLIHKKGDTTEVSSYRPISLLSFLYKVFSNVILQRLDSQINQPQEQARFRKKYSTIDHLHVVNQLQEQTHEYQLPLYMAFVYYKKAFDSIELQPLLGSLSSQRNYKTYINFIEHLYSNAKSVVRTEIDSKCFRLRRGLRQGDTISPILFNIALNNEVIDKIEWGDRGINIDGEFLPHLLDADDLILFSHSANELQSMLEDISEKSNKIGLTINTDKTKIMRNEFTENTNTIKINNKTIENTEKYIYLGQTITNNHDQTIELHKRIGLG